jgi:serine/threonine-protein kinase
MFGYFMLSTYLCAGIAFVIALNVNSLAKQLKKAREVGSYKLVERLGEGGMGEVWVAKHRMLARPAAVKLIRPEMLGADERSRKTAIRRFEQEAQATAALKSYHTIDASAWAESRITRQALRARRTWQGGLLLAPGVPLSG